MKERSVYLSRFWIVLGIVLWVLSAMEKLDVFWGSCGFALFAVGALQLLRRHRIRNNPELKEKVEIAETDERNHFIRCKAWAWAGYLFILITSLTVIVLRAVGQETLSLAASYTVCLMLVLYWVSYWVLQKKY